MSDEDLLGYLFDLLAPQERVAIALRLTADPDLAARLGHLRAALGPLVATAEHERENPPGPAPGLALRAIARVAQHVVEHEPRAAQPVMSGSSVAAMLKHLPADDPVEFDFEAAPRRPAPRPADGPEAAPGRRFRADLLVAAGIAFVAFGLVVTGIARAREQQRVYACQNGLRTLHAGLAGYADAHPQGRYPQIGDAAHPTADTFAASLRDQGHLPAGFRPGCPAASEFVAFAYTLGYRDAGGEVRGLRRPDGPAACDEHDLMPISADCPTARAAPSAGPVSPHGGCMNVLFVGGNVRTTRSALVGPNGDDIYRNQFGHVGAGANACDAVLGRPGDQP